MTGPETHPEDALVFIVFAKPDMSAFIPEEITITNGASDIALAKKYMETLPIGFLVFVWDKKQQYVDGHDRPLIVSDPRAIALNGRALHKVASLIKKRIG
jgi:hypothetical protein